MPNANAISDVQVSVPTNINTTNTTNAAAAAVEASLSLAVLRSYARNCCDESRFASEVYKYYYMH